MALHDDEAVIRSLNHQPLKYNYYSYEIYHHSHVIHIHTLWMYS